jgi:hypothetical protein
MITKKDKPLEGKYKRQTSKSGGVVQKGEFANATVRQRLEASIRGQGKGDAGPLALGAADLQGAVQQPEAFGHGGQPQPLVVPGLDFREIEAVAIIGD